MKYITGDESHSGTLANLWVGFGFNPIIHADNILRTYDVNNEFDIITLSSTSQANYSLLVPALTSNASDTHDQCLILLVRAIGVRQLHKDRGPRRQSKGRALCAASAAKVAAFCGAFCGALWQQQPACSADAGRTPAQPTGVHTHAIFATWHPHTPRTSRTLCIQHACRTSGTRFVTLSISAGTNADYSKPSRSHTYRMVSIIESSIAKAAPL